jgi:ubiquinone/menaquinone biosynthesis C-methylase UbiE
VSVQIEKDVQGVAATLLRYYDRHVGRYSPALATALVRVAGVGHGGRALDVGCGTGALAAALAARLGPARVAAVDRSQAAVEACAHAVPGADVRLASAERLPFADGEFAAVLGQLVIDKVDGPAALREMRRVARPGAAVAACVWDFETGMTLLRAYWDAALAVDPRGARAAGAGGRPPYSRPEELHELWSEAGLDAVEVGELVVGADYDDLDDAWLPFAAGGVGNSGAYCASLDESTREALKAEFSRRIGSPEGPFRLSARAWYARGTAPL